ENTCTPFRKTGGSSKQRAASAFTSAGANPAYFGGLQRIRIMKLRPAPLQCERPLRRKNIPVNSLIWIDSPHAYAIIDKNIQKSNFAGAAGKALAERSLT